MTALFAPPALAASLAAGATLAPGSGSAPMPAAVARQPPGAVWVMLWTWMKLAAPSIGLESATGEPLMLTRLPSDLLRSVPRNSNIWLVV